MEDIIRVEHLVKTFGETRAVDDVTFTVKRGEIFGFLGPNGAGKTTAIKVLITLLKKTSGIAEVDGMDVAERAAEVRSIIGYASQEVGVDDDLTGRENLMLQCRFHHLSREETASRVQEVIATIGLEDAADRRAGTYSGGMRKRLDLGTALISKPQLLFLDEPTTGLDPQSRAATWEYIRKLNRQGMTIFLTTQYMEEADRLANRLCIIDHGKIVAEGTPEGLKAQIGADQIAMSLRDGNDAERRRRAMERLAKVPGVTDIKDCQEGLVCQGGIIVYAKNGPAIVPQLVREMDDAKENIESLTLAVPSLDDVFLKYTGRKMRVEGAKAMPSRRPGTRRRR